MQSAEKRRAKVVRGEKRDAGATTEQNDVEQGDADRGQFVLVWDPELLSASDYAELVTLLGDLVRAEGGAGIRRVRAFGFGVPVESGVPA